MIQSSRRRNKFIRRTHFYHRPKVKNGFQFKDSTDEGDFSKSIPADDSECLFCNGKYSHDGRDEMWVMCAVCGCWAHEECAGTKKDAYMYAIFVSKLL